MILLVFFTVPRLNKLSYFPAVPVKRTTTTNEKPPFVAMFKVREPASRYCDKARLKLTWPLPYGPPVALNVGKVPTAGLRRVDTDANDGVGIRAMNLVQAVVEYCDMKFPPV